MPVKAVAQQQAKGLTTKKAASGQREMLMAISGGRRQNESGER